MVTFRNKHLCAHKMSHDFTDIRPLSHKIASGCNEVKFSHWIMYTFDSDDSKLNWNRVQCEILPSKLDRFLSTIDVLWEKITALIEFS